MKSSNEISKVIVATLVCMMVTLDVLAWGQKGHDTTCEIAERHLSKKAKKAITKILEGESIVFWANWLDHASNQPEYRYTKTWHFRDVEEGKSFANSTSETGDVLTAIESQVKILKSREEVNLETQALALKMVIHLIGDLHCPMHIGHKADLGGNKWQVRFFDEGTNLHKVWDTKIIESGHKWSYKEWADQLDREDKKSIAAITEGTPYTWGEETYEIAKTVYAKTPVGSKISYDELYDWTKVAELQLLRGGLRLAKVLNDIFK
ncbi:MAG: S1/P1 nuclease [Bacteroidaceae bacterium]|nr:S1/P1 nuclease [Bacteroidaceae bacterium]